MPMTTWQKTKLQRQTLQDWYSAKTCCTDQAGLDSQQPGKAAGYIAGVQPSILSADRNKNENEERGWAARVSAAKAQLLSLQPNLRRNSSGAKYVKALQTEWHSLQNNFLKRSFNLFYLAFKKKFHHFAQSSKTVQLHKLKKALKTQFCSCANPFWTSIYNVTESSLHSWRLRSSIISYSKFFASFQEMNIYLPFLRRLHGAVIKRVLTYFKSNLRLAYEIRDSEVKIQRLSLKQDWHVFQTTNFKDNLRNTFFFFFFLEMCENIQEKEQIHMQPLGVSQTSFRPGSYLRLEYKT